MKAAFAFFAVFAAVLVSVAAAEEEKPFEYGVFEPAVADHGDRHRRLTCDLLSFTTKWVSVNHSACAAHCLALLRGYRGGFCDAQGVCVCRR